MEIQMFQWPFSPKIAMMVVVDTEEIIMAMDVVLIQEAMGHSNKQWN